MIRLPDIYIRLTTMQNGEICHRHEEPGHSWTRNAWNLMFAAMTNCGGSQDSNSGSFGAGHMSAKSHHDGSVRTETSITPNRNSAVVVDNQRGFVPGGVGDMTGILVGSGDTAFDINNSVLAARIRNGTSAGQLQYSAQAVPLLVYAAGVWTVTHARTFTNQSGADVIINEIGISGGYNMFSTMNSQFLLTREVISVPYTVAHTAAVTIEYGMSLDFSGIDT